MDVREAEKKRKMALREDPVDAPGRAEGDKKEEVVVVEPIKKTKSRSKKRKSKAKRTANATGAPEEAEQYRDNNVGESSTRVTSTGNSCPFTFDFEVESHRHRLAIEGTGCSEHTTAASTVNAVSSPQLGGKRHRKGSKSMSQLKANENPMQDNSRDAAVERLKAEALPVSLEAAREKRTTLRRERSGTIQFLRQRTFSRGSSVAGSRPATPPYRDSAPDMDDARLEEITEVGRPLTSETNLPVLNATASTSAHKEASSGTEKKWQIVRQQRPKKQQSDQLAAVRPGPAQSKPSRTEKQPKAAAKSPNRDHARINMEGSATASSIITQAKTLDQVVVSPKAAVVVPDPNARLSYIAAARETDDNVSYQRPQKADVTTKGRGTKEYKHQTHVAAVSPISKPRTTHHAKPSIPGGCLSPQPLQKVEITKLVDLGGPGDQGDVAAASPVRDLRRSHDATTNVTDEKRSRCSPQTSEFILRTHSSGSSKDQIHITTNPLKSKVDTAQHANADSVDQNTPPQCLQTSEIITTIDISGDTKGQTSFTADSLNPDGKVSHHVIRDIADEYPSSHQQRKSQSATLENPGFSMHQTHQNGESTLITEPGLWLRDEDGRSTDTEDLEKAIAAWQDQSDDEEEISTNHQAPSRDPLSYSINNEAYFFRDRPFVVPPQLENEENIQNGTCFPEIPPLLGNPYTGEFPEHVPSTPPLICRCKLHGGSQALINYDPSIHRMIIHPSLHPLPDLRNDPYHPDWLPPFKLAEFQAYEQSGYPVYRFDRVTFECALASCRIVLKDHVRSTLLCNGCGPYTDVRYCSKEHLFEDCKSHWKICGLVPPRVVWDDWSMPSRYKRRYPAIKDIRGRRTPERQRQQAYSIHHRASDYVIFSDWKDEQATGQECRGTGKPIVFLLFRDGDPTKDTFNRLLNIVFFGKPFLISLPLPSPLSIPQTTPCSSWRPTLADITQRRPPPHAHPHPPLPPHPLSLPRAPPLDPRPPKRPQPPTLPRILLRPPPPRLRAEPLPRRLGWRRGRLVLGGLQARGRA